MACSGDLIADRYRLVAPLGSGGMGVVWTATDQHRNRIVALKQVRLAAFAPPERSDHARDLLRKEADTAAGLSHPHIVTVHEVVESDGEPWLVMEFVQGRDLATLLAEDGPLEPRRAARIGAQIASALTHAHAESVVHRDITPRNILVTDSDHAKLTDFGIARVGDGTLTIATPAQGVPAYYAPEVANGVPPGSRSDVFALGAVLYAAVEGAPPWGTGSEAEIMDRAARGIVPSPERAGRRLTPVLMRLLRKFPRLRPDAAAAERMLRDVADGRIRRGRAIAAGVAAGLVAIAVGVAVMRPVEAAATPRVGDARTADPCALISTQPFERFGDTALESDYGNFNRCDVSMESETGRFMVTVQFDPATSVLPNGEVESHGELVVVRQGRVGDRCEAVVRLPDSHEVNIWARAERGDTPELCAIVDIATDGALAVLAQGEVPRRQATFPAVSLANVDACGLLDAATVATVPSLEDTTPDPGFGSWECAWDKRDSDAEIVVRYDRNVDELDGMGTPTQVRDRAAAVNQDDESECDVTVLHRPYQDPYGTTAGELVVVEVAQAVPIPDPCAPAIAVAAVAVAHLPTPS